MKIEVINQSGNKRKTGIQLNSKVFGINPNKHCIYLAVKSEMASLRQGTSSSKTRGEVQGGGRKPWKQKGTGRARIGSLRNPSRVHGGVAFGPKPRKYSIKVNNKVRKNARKSILSYKFKQNKIIVIDQLKIENSKTKNFINFLDALNISDKKITILLENVDENVFLSSRNLYKINVTNVNNASTYDLIDCDLLIIDKNSINFLNESL